MQVIPERTAIRGDANESHSCYPFSQRNTHVPQLHFQVWKFVRGCLEPEFHFKVQAPIPACPSSLCPPVDVRGLVLGAFGTMDRQARVGVVHVRQRIHRHHVLALPDDDAHDEGLGRRKSDIVRGKRGGLSRLQDVYPALEVSLGLYLRWREQWSQLHRFDGPTNLRGVGAGRYARAMVNVGWQKKARIPLEQGIKIPRVMLRGDKRASALRYACGGCLAA